MNADQLLNLYDRVVEAPDAIARLRRFVLELAVRGKLVEQDPADEPTSAFLERIAAERARLAKTAETRSSRQLAAIEEQELPFDLPTGWSWSRLGSLIDLVSGQHLQPSEYSQNPREGLPYITGPSDFGANGLEISRYACVRKAVAIRGQLLLTVKGSGVGKTAICDLREVAISRQLMALTAILWDGRYLELITHRLAVKLQQEARSLIPGISREDVTRFVVALPPLAEQRRIVAKVDELMALLDRLEAARGAREATRKRLTVASLARLTGPDTDAKTFSARARFALDALPKLTARPDQIKQLRQTILNLAVRGKLVEQDPTDEPATALLKRIVAEKSQSLPSGRGRKPRQLPGVDFADAPYELPRGWVWARFPDLGIFARGKSKHRPRNDPALYTGGTHLMIQTGDVARSGGRIKTYTNKYNDLGLAQSMLWPKGALCITIAANIADSGILEFDACFPDSVVGFVPAPVLESAAYFEYFVRTAKANLLEFAPATAQKNINLEILRSVLIPLPPLAEQHRIVARVDALMALCDQLEAALAEADTGRQHLLEALLHEALGPTAEAMTTAPSEKILTTCGALGAV